MGRQFLVYICLLLPGVSLGKDYFTAAVFEHRPRHLNTSEEILHKSPQEIITDNLNIYEKAVKLASKNGADILLFSEYGLFVHITQKEALKKFAEYIPDPKTGKINPCVDKKYNSLMLSTASCWAREHNMYIVVNFGGLQTCEDTCAADKIDECKTDCPKDGVHVYNTNMVFDREGNFIAKYRKMHPYYEHLYAPKNDLMSFKTEFGTFGIQICFDLLWEEAVLQARNYGIDTLLYSTWWYDDINPLTSVEWQQAFALENKVNLLAADTHLPKTASLGSGIFSKDEGALVYSYEPDGESKLLLTNIKTKDNAVIPHLKKVIVVSESEIYEKTEERGDKFPEHCLVEKMGQAQDASHDYRCFKSHMRRHSIVKLEDSFGEVKACQNNFCCYLKYSAVDMNENFFLTAFSGLNEVRDHFQWAEETCLLTRCDPFEGKPCVLLASTSKTVFKELELKATFESKHVYATVAKTNRRLAPKNEWSYSTECSATTLKFRSDSNEPLLKAALFGRNYQKDPKFIPYIHEDLK